jgi:hypothetical protein
VILENIRRSGYAGHLALTSRDIQPDTGARLPGTIVPSETAYGAVMKHIDHAGGELAARD